MKHLIHIGYPKAGSTFLQAWFEAHPEIFYKPGALGGYYDFYSLCRDAAQSKNNDSHYRYRVTSGEALSVPHEATGQVRMGDNVANVFPLEVKRSQAQSCHTLRDLFPGSRVLIVTRGFSGVLRSAYSQIIKTGGVLSPREMYAVLEANPQSQLPHCFDYDYLLGLYTEVFGAENLIILPYELLRDDQTAFLALLQDEMELTHTELDVGRRNASFSPAELYWYPVISRRVSALARRLGGRGFRKVYTWHIHQIRKNKWRRVIEWLHRAQPDKVITASDFPDNAPGLFAGKAESLRDHPLYAPYAKEYLWET